MILRDVFKYALLTGRFKIAHRIPGRLRLEVPDLALVPVAYDDQIAAARKILEKLPGMQRISVNRVTRSILFEYDSAMVPEDEMLARLERLFTIGMQRFGELDASMDLPERLRSLQVDLSAVVEFMRTRHHAAKEKN